MGMGHGLRSATWLVTAAAGISLIWSVGGSLRAQGLDCPATIACPDSGHCECDAQGRLLHFRQEAPEGSGESVDLEYDDQGRLTVLHVQSGYRQQTYVSVYSEDGQHLTTTIDDNGDPSDDVSFSITLDEQGRPIRAETADATMVCTMTYAADGSQATTECASDGVPLLRTVDTLDENGGVSFRQEDSNANGTIDRECRFEPHCATTTVCGTGICQTVERSQAESCGEYATSPSAIANVPNEATSPGLVVYLRFEWPEGAQEPFTWLRDRVAELNVEAPTIRWQDDGILVGLPGLAESEFERARLRLQTPPRLTFRRVHPDDAAYWTSVMAQLPADCAARSNGAPECSDYRDLVEALGRLAEPTASPALPAGAWPVVSPDYVYDHRGSIDYAASRYVPMLVNSEAELSGDVVDSVVAQSNPQTYRWFVSLTLSSEGTAGLCDLTTRSVGQAVAMLVDDRVIIAPVVEEPICEGRMAVHLSGTGSAYAMERQAEDLANLIRSGTEMPIITEVCTSIIGPVP